VAKVKQKMYAKEGTAQMPGGEVPFWGYASEVGKPPRLPGPLVEVCAGDSVDFELVNELSEPVSLVFPGQTDVKVPGKRRKCKVTPSRCRPRCRDAKKIPARRRRRRRLRRCRSRSHSRKVDPERQNERMISLTRQLEPGQKRTVTYRVRTRKPGVYLYHSGSNPATQVQMGLYGVLVVRPRGFDDPASPNYRTAYGEGTRSEYDVEKIMVLGEVDSRWHEAVAGGDTDEHRDFRPDYWLINGRSFPHCAEDADGSTQPESAAVQCTAGQRVLLRLVNAGYLHHTIYLGGLRGRVVGWMMSPLALPGKDATYEKLGITLGAGQTADVILTPESPGKYMIHAREYSALMNEEQFGGGMMTRLTVGPA